MTAGTTLKEPALQAVPTCFTSVPLTVYWGTQETNMRLVGGLMGVTQEEEMLTVEPECGWALVYEEPVDPLSPQYETLERRKKGT
jgi:hypothetical protein